MVEAQLTEQAIHEGGELVKALDAAGMSPDAAFWFFFPDVRAWKLVLAEIKLGSEGPRDVYKRIQRALATIEPEPKTISLEDIAVAKPDAPIVAVLKRALRTGPGLSGIRFTQNVIDGVLIEDAYIYRLAQAA